MIRNCSVPLTYFSLCKSGYAGVCWVSLHWWFCLQPSIAIYWQTPPLSSAWDACGLFTSSCTNLYFIHWLYCAIDKRVPSLPPNTDLPPIFTAVDPTTKLIQVAPRTQGKKGPNIFYDDHGFINQPQKFNIILHNINGGCILRKRKHPAPPLSDIGPLFYSPYVKAIHGATLRKEFDLPHWSSLVTIRYTASSKNTGHFFTIRDNLSPSRTTHARLTPAPPSQSVSRKSTTAHARSQLCTNVLHPLQCSATSTRYPSNLTIADHKYFFTAIDGSKVGSCAVAIFCCPVAFCSWSIITINNYYPIFIHPSYYVNNVYIYITNFHFAFAVTIYYWAVVAIDGCLVTIQSSYTLNIYMFLL